MRWDLPLNIPAMNAASRVSQILLELSKSGGNDQARNNWLRAFGLWDLPSEDSEDLLFENLQAFRYAVAEITSELDALQVPPELYRDALANLRSAASPQRMAEAWTGVSLYAVGSEIRLTVGWASVFLRNEEDAIDPDALAELRSKVDELEKEIQTAKLPPHMNRLTTQALATLRRVFALYPVTGIAPVKQAMQTVYGSVALAKGAVATEADKATPEAKSAFKKFVDLVKDVGEVSEAVTKVKDAGAAIGSLGDALTPLIDQVVRSISNG